MRFSGNCGEELGAELRLPLGPPFDHLSDRAAGIEMTPWLIDDDGALTNQAPIGHDEIRWIGNEALPRLDLADARYLGILTRAMSTNRRATDERRICRSACEGSVTRPSPRLRYGFGHRW